MNDPTQDALRSLVFKWSPDLESQLRTLVAVIRDGSTENPKAYYTDIMQEIIAAEVTKALDEVEAAAPQDIPIFGLNAVGRRLNHLNADWRKALAAQRAKYRPNEDKSDE